MPNLPISSDVSCWKQPRFGRIFIIGDHPYITSAHGLGGWGQKMAIFADVQYNLCWRIVGGWVKKSPKMCWCNIRMVPRENASIQRPPTYLPYLHRPNKVIQFLQASEGIRFSKKSVTLHTKWPLSSCLLDLLAHLLFFLCPTGASLDTNLQWVKIYSVGDYYFFCPSLFELPDF